MVISVLREIILSSQFAVALFLTSSVSSSDYYRQSGDVSVSVGNKINGKVIFHVAVPATYHHNSSRNLLPQEKPLLLLDFCNTIDHLERTKIASIDLMMNITGTTTTTSAKPETGIDEIVTTTVSTAVRYHNWVGMVPFGACRRHVDNLDKLARTYTNLSALIVYPQAEGKLIGAIPKSVSRPLYILEISWKSKKSLGASPASNLSSGQPSYTLLKEGTAAVIPSPHPFTPTTDDPFNKTSVLFVCISFIILMVISIAWLTFYYVQRFRFIHSKDRLAREVYNAAKKALREIPLKTLQNGDSELKPGMELCAICIDKYRVSETVRTLPCGHIFHRNCIDPWLLEQRSCPMCKLDILKYYNLQVKGMAGLRSDAVVGGGGHATTGVDSSIIDDLTMQQAEQDWFDVYVRNSSLFGGDQDSNDDIPVVHIDLPVSVQLQTSSNSQSAAGTTDRTFEIHNTDGENGSSKTTGGGSSSSPHTRRCLCPSTTAIAISPFNHTCSGGRPSQSSMCAANHQYCPSTSSGGTGGCGHCRGNCPSHHNSAIFHPSNASNNGSPTQSGAHNQICAVLHCPAPASTLSTTDYDVHSSSTGGGGGGRTHQHYHLHPLPDLIDCSYLDQSYHCPRIINPLDHHPNVQIHHPARSSLSDSPSPRTMAGEDSEVDSRGGGSQDNGSYNNQFNAYDDDAKNNCHSNSSQNGGSRPRSKNGSVGGNSYSSDSNKQQPHGSGTHGRHRNTGSAKHSRHGRKSSHGSHGSSSRGSHGSKVGYDRSEGHGRQPSHDSQASYDSLRSHGGIIFGAVNASHDLHHPYHQPHKLTAESSGRNGGAASSSAPPGCIAQSGIGTSTEIDSSKVAPYYDESNDGSDVASSRQCGRATESANIGSASKSAVACHGGNTSGSESEYTESHELIQPGEKRATAGTAATQCPKDQKQQQQRSDYPKDTDYIAVFSI